MSDRTITERKQIPDSPYYMLCDDPFFSGWGDAKNATNTIICPCTSYGEAELLKLHAEQRGDQQRIRIVSNKPKMYSNVVYSLFTPENAPTWYTAEITLRRDSEDYYRVKFDEKLRQHVYNGIESTAEYTFWEAFNKAVSVAQKCGVRHLEINWKLNENRQQEADAARITRMHQLEAALRALMPIAELDSVYEAYADAFNAAEALIGKAPARKPDPTCQICDGYGFRDCPYCIDGNIEDDEGSEVECPNCIGTGEISCKCSK